MDGVLKSKWFSKARVLAALVCAALHGQAYAVELACPSLDFPTFLRAFSASEELQRQFTAPTVRAMTLQPAQTDLVGPQTRPIDRAQLTFPVIAPVSAAPDEGLETTFLKHDRVSLVDKRVGNSDIKVYTFTRQACWVLSGVADWSITEANFHPSLKPGMNPADSFCYQKAMAYGTLIDVHPALMVEFYAAMLDNFVCASASGNPDASNAAASLSLSGMAPQLPTPQVEALFKAAAAASADGVLMLSLFYCDGNNIASSGPCLDPARAEQVLLDAAPKGWPEIASHLGYSFEKGELVTHDVARALACYQLAIEGGSDSARMRLERLRKQRADLPAASFCY